MPYSIFYSLLFLLLLAGCGKPKDVGVPIVAKHHIAINVDEYNILPYDSIVREITFVPLETADYCLLGDITEVAVNDDLIAINSFGKLVLSFDKSGKYKFSLGSLGVGPNEYVSIDGISIQDGIVYLYDSSIGFLLSFNSTDGTFIKKDRLPQLYTKAYVCGEHIYATDYTKGFRLVSIALDSLDNECELYKDANDLIASYKFREKITRSENRLFFTDPLQGVVYELKNGMMQPFIRFDFGDYELLSSEEEIESANSRHVTEIGDFLISDSLVHVTFHAKGNLMISLYDMRIKKACNINVLEWADKREKAYQKIPLTRCLSDNTFYQYTWFYNYLKEDSIPSKYATYKRLSSLNTESNPYLVLYKLGL
ncbi:MAG: 6-bladed beta-propeller [Bacteroidaceae bacterium]|nr:6-bladed beta-propeller [Bacteroidaceae bacterium]